MPHFFISINILILKAEKVSEVVVLGLGDYEEFGFRVNTLSAILTINGVKLKSEFDALKSILHCDDDTKTKIETILVAYEAAQTSNELFDSDFFELAKIVCDSELEISEAYLKNCNFMGDAAVWIVNYNESLSKKIETSKINEVKAEQVFLYILDNIK